MSTPNRKRTLALAAAAVTGLDCVLFVDDDVLELRTGDVLAALAHLRHRPDHDVVGWAAVQFPDNSVSTTHVATTSAGRRRASSAAERSSCGSREPCRRGFRPSTTRTGCSSSTRSRTVRWRSAATSGSFPRTSTVRSDAPLHVGAPVEAATKPRYWDDVRRKRERLLARITEKLRELHASEPFDDHVVAALRALYGSRHELTRSTPESLAGFVVRWREDLATWDDAVGRLRNRETLVEALAYLGLHEAWIVTS